VKNHKTVTYLVREANFMLVPHMPLLMLLLLLITLITTAAVVVVVIVIMGYIL